VDKCCFTCNICNMKERAAGGRVVVLVPVDFGQICNYEKVRRKSANKTSFEGKSEIFPTF
jgi:hypothetical protein